MQSSCLMPNITSKERISVWDAVSVYIQEHLQLRQGVRIPALGSFDVVPRWVKDGNKTVIFLMPTFRLARNLVITHNLTDDKEYLPGHKELEPLKVAEVAANACMSQQRAENCMRGLKWRSCIKHRPRSIRRPGARRRRKKGLCLFSAKLGETKQLLAPLFTQPSRVKGRSRGRLPAGCR
ncbi:coiled-coil domain-containing protein 81-like isoform X2 [Anser cygnoides]|uniref:coiled-coil domain-containing protein 81-like isoform X2 n=1 Tax=Anser cygnoides TaxID=8845 RepID=UPI0034D21EF6